MDNEGTKLQAEARKFEAEARKADADVKAQAAKVAAELVKINAEAEQIRQTTRYTTAAAAASEITLRAQQRAESELLAANKYHHVYHYTEDVNPKSVAYCMAQLNVWRRNGAGEDKAAMEIIFTSPGGSVVDGLALFDFLQQLRREGHHITTGTLGMAASMAGILLQAGDVRWMGAEAWVLIHQVQAGMMGSFGALEDRMGWLKRIQARILDIFAARAKEAGEKGSASHPYSRKTLEKEWTRTDWWLSSAECLSGGVVDEVR